MVCVQCNVFFKQRSNTTGKFCSLPCWYQSVREAIPEGNCAGCGCRFLARVPGASRVRKYCTDACRLTPSLVKADRRFFSKVNKNTSSGCWEWTAGANAAGYGKYSDWAKTGRRSLAAHRFSYERFVGPIAEGLFVCHRCDNPPCVRPDHLFLGTAKDNSADMVTKLRGGGKKMRGANHPGAKLSREDVVQILKDDRSPVPIALQFGVSVGAIERIRMGLSWTYDVEISDLRTTYLQRRDDRSSFVGRTFGFLLVVSKEQSAGGRRRWRCECRCGKSIVVSSSKLVDGSTKGCGCLRGKRTAQLLHMFETPDLSTAVATAEARK